MRTRVTEYTNQRHADGIDDRSRILRKAPPKSNHRFKPSQLNSHLTTTNTAMHTPLHTFSRATLFHLILNPFLSTPTRAIASPAAANALKLAPHFHTHSLNRASIAYPQCAPANLYTTMSSSHSQEHPAKTNAQGDAQPDQHKEPYLALPDASTADPTHKLDLSEGGSSVKLDHLGPLVVNQDGTLSRIANWEHMTEIEKKNTLRVLGKRNKLRMDALKEAGVGQEGEDGNK